jgi:hypothetical protein
MSVGTVAVAGDWHGDQVWAQARIESLGERGITTVLHVGDFGIWPGPTGKIFLRAVEAACAKRDVILLVVPGNHEDWGRLTALWSSQKNRDETGALLPLRLRDHILLLPRGYRWAMGGRTFVSLGGAPSIDFESRTPGRDWWPDGEMMSRDDVELTIAGGPADVMITHDSPGPPWCVPKIEAMIRTNPMGWPKRALDYARIGTERVTEAFLGVAPRLLVHGHFHAPDETMVRLPGADHDTRIWSLGMNRQEGNIRLLDLDSLTEPAPEDMTP